MKENKIVPKPVSPVTEEKVGAAEIRKAYFHNWYESCKDIYNKERRKKRKEKRKKNDR